MSDPEVSYEQIIGNRYALYGPIATGGMATVHFARLLGTAGFQRTVAVKRLRVEFLESPEFVTTLLDEARLASRIRHPNVVNPLDMVTAEDEIFVVMEYVSGESLSRLLARLAAQGKALETEIATGILAGVLHGLHAAHEARDAHGEPLGIVHRDVSPQNILVGSDGLARLLDFGIAKGRGRLATTRAGQLKGKVSYMAPEQILGEEPDRRTDVYSAAVVLWEAVTGRRLFPGSEGDKDGYKLIPKILEADIDPPSVVNPAVPQALNGIVMRGLNRDRGARYATAREFAVALEDDIGIATSRLIGEWVEEVARDALVGRAVQLAALESASADDADAMPVVDATVMRRKRKRGRSRGAERSDPAPDRNGYPITLPGDDVARRARAETVPDHDGVADLGSERPASSGERPSAQAVPYSDGPDSDRAPPSGDMVTEVYARRHALKGPPKLPGERRRRSEPPDSSDSVPPRSSDSVPPRRSDPPDPSDSVPPRSTGSVPPNSARHRRHSSSAPPSLGGGLASGPAWARDTINVPVRSNRWLVIAMVIAIIAVVLAIAVLG